MVNREDRNHLIEVIEDYIAEKIKAFEFSDKIEEIKLNTKDNTIGYIANDLWYIYDDCIDHTIVGSKETWDFLQRMILFLQSDYEIKRINNYQWTIRQSIAVLLFGLSAIVILKNGYYYYLFYLAIPFGVISIYLSSWKHININKFWHEYIKIMPFTKVNQIYTVRRATLNFKKQRYPKYLITRKIRSRFVEFILYLLSKLAWLIFSPLILLYQSLPEKIENTIINNLPKACPDSVKREKDLNLRNVDINPQCDQKSNLGAGVKKDG